MNIPMSPISQLGHGYRQALNYDNKTQLSNTRIHIHFSWAGNNLIGPIAESPNSSFVSTVGRRLPLWKRDERVFSSVARYSPS
jgi:hypothetical protein